MHMMVSLIIPLTTGKQCFSTVVRALGRFFSALLAHTIGHVQDTQYQVRKVLAHACVMQQVSSLASSITPLGPPCVQVKLGDAALHTSTKL
jgi:hypothetical protein